MVNFLSPLTVFLLQLNVVMGKRGGRGGGGGGGQFTEQKIGWYKYLLPSYSKTLQ